MGTLVWRILGTGGGILAGMIANRLVIEGWRRAGRDVNIDPRNPHTPVGEAVAFAALTGLAVGAARTLVTRKAARYYEESAGHLPKPMREGKA